MLFQDLSCTAETTFRDMSVKGIYGALRVEGSAILAISNQFKLAVSGVLDLGALGEDVYAGLCERYKREIFAVEEAQSISFPEMELIVVRISTRERFCVFVIFFRRSPPFTQEETGWAGRFTDLYYEKVLLLNESYQDKDYMNHVFESAESSILTFDLEQTLIACNTSAAKLFALDNTDGFRNYEECNPQFFEAIHLVARTGEKSRIDYLPFSFLNRKILLSTAISPLRNSKKSVVGVVAVCHDVTELKLMEHTVDQLKQYGLLGEVATGLAHDIKNPLTAIRGCAKLMTMPTVTQEAQAHAAAVILHEVQQIDQTLNQTLSFGNITNEGEAHWVQVNDVLEGCIQLAERQKGGRDIQLVREFDPELPVIRGKNYSFQQIFLNTILNALQSIPSKGSVHVRTRWDAEEGAIKVKISDTGTGMSDAVAEQIFNPYFTTKRNGTGMGMFVVKRVLTRYQGTIAIETEEGKGSSVLITLPAHPGKEAAVGEMCAGCG